MVNVWKILRSGTLGNRPTSRSYGEPYVNFAENQFGVINSSGGAQDLLGAPIFSTTATYTTGQTVSHGGGLYVALVAVAAGAWNPVQWSPLASQASVFASGTQMLFLQSAAPTGWTRVTTNDDALLRIVGSAAPGSGGANGFNATFNVQTTTTGFTLTQATLPNYQMTANNTYYSPSGTPTGVTASSPNYQYQIVQNAPTVNLNGSGVAHTHGIITNIKYVDSLVASKN